MDEWIEERLQDPSIRQIGIPIWVEGEAMKQGC